MPRLPNNRNETTMRRLEWILVYLSIVGTMSVYAQPTAQAPCSTGGPYDLLDFWVGKWEVKDTSGVVIGHNHISKILDDCTVMEEWTSTGRSRGKSLNFFNPTIQKWQQVWIDNFGMPLYFDGSARPDSMIYTGETYYTQDQSTLQKMILAKIYDDEVHQTWLQSNDKGNTWNTVFFGVYKRID